jgi:hypothetical protein
MNEITIEQVREELFATLRDLRREEKPMELDRAKQIANVAGKLIDSAKVEVEFMRVTGGMGSGFITNKSPKKIGAAAGAGAPGVTVHRLKG